MAFGIVLIFPGFAPRADAEERAVSLALLAPDRLLILDQGADGQVVLRRTDGAAKVLWSQDLTWPSGILPVNPTLKKDRNGRPYLVWEEPGLERSGVGFGRVPDTGPVSPEPLRLPPGSNRLPDLAFDAGNSPWITWVNARPEGQTLYVRQTETGRTWALAWAGAFLAPQILAGGPGRVWVFWGETSLARFELFFRVFDGSAWSPAASVVNAGQMAIQAFAAALDDAGNPWLAWSQYSGREYEILASRQGKTGWSSPVRLSARPESFNTNPFLAWAAGLGPVVSWVRTTDRGSAVCLRVFSQGRWGGETVLPDVEAGEAAPQVAVENGYLAAVWRSRGRPAWRLFPLLPLAVSSQNFPDSFPPFGPPAWLQFGAFPTIINNPDLNESGYIGFGDSITYGVIDSEYHPELGYVPRLQALLTDNFGLTTVANEGVGSEITQNGLARINTVLQKDQDRYILILEGTNDTVTKIYNPDVTGFNLQQMVSRSRTFGAFPALATLLPRYDASAMPDRIAEVNQRIQDLVETLAVPLVDFHQQFLDYPASKGGVKALLSHDLLHPNEEGYQFMAEHWFEAIRAFPFPPEHVQITREYDRIFLYEQPGNMIRWEDNEKIYDRSGIRGYRLYRKPSGPGDGAYELLANIDGVHEYFDSAISSDQHYTYVLSTVTTDGVEGPCCLPITF